MTTSPKPTTGPSQLAMLPGAVANPSGRAKPPLRGDIHVTASMEVLQTGYLHAVAAAAGCAVSKPFPDAYGTDYNVSTRRLGM